MLQQKLDLIAEQTSPLFRIMWVTNPDDLSRRHFDNNISAFHIGHGLILSVAHNLRSENPLPKSIDEHIFSEEILRHLDPARQTLFNQCYQPDPVTGIRHLQVPNPAILQTITETIRSLPFDTRWLTLAQRNISLPHLIVQFSDDLFYKNKKLTGFFNARSRFYEPTLNRYTFLLQVELVQAFYGSDIAVYRIRETPREIINALPSLEVDFGITEDRDREIYCLQSSPAGFLGRLLNKSWMEGYLDHHQVFNDRTGGNYILEGIRYLIRGYFRFGSSGAPYLVHDPVSGRFRVNAVQSEASPIQLSINNNREGNYQYVNAIASPLKLVEKELKHRMEESAFQA